jgi:hypothetical protein
LPAKSVDWRAFPSKLRHIERPGVGQTASSRVHAQISHKQLLSKNLRLVPEFSNADSLASQHQMCELFAPLALTKRGGQRKWDGCSGKQKHPFLSLAINPPRISGKSTVNRHL